MLKTSKTPFSLEWIFKVLFHSFSAFYNSIIIVPNHKLGCTGPALSWQHALRWCNTQLAATDCRSALFLLVHRGRRLLCVMCVRKNKYRSYMCTCLDSQRVLMTQHGAEQRLTLRLWEIVLIQRPTTTHICTSFHLEIKDSEKKTDLISLKQDKCGLFFSWNGRRLHIKWWIKGSQRGGHMNNIMQPHEETACYEEKLSWKHAPRFIPRDQKNMLTTRFWY